ncbi:RNA polymerase factor sigma-54 [Brochothrix thermosphacta DSM 20171 = FSL F6-1036]|nr:RNA polymerase factor sigma-54 [Brochothrix thermosphacta DSM 20171 = FSL F6-1036]
MNLEHKHLQEQRQTIKMTQELSQAIAVLQYTKEELTAYLEDKALENPFLDIVVDQKSVLDKNRFKETYKEQYKNTSDDYDVIGQLPEKTKNLAQFLHEQVMLSMREMKLRDIVQFLVDNLDENGYLKFTYQELSDSIDATEVEFENGLTLLQQLDPAGIGARSLSECICLQIDRDIRAPKSAFRIIQNHFEEFSQKKMAENCYF